MAWKTYDESIDLLERRFHYFPQSFRWRGQRYDVDAVERDWIPRRSPGRRCFRLQCVAGVVEVYHDLVANTWHLHRARWVAAPTRPAWASRPARVGPRQIAFQE